MRALISLIFRLRTRGAIMNRKPPDTKRKTIGRKAWSGRILKPVKKPDSFSLKQIRAAVREQRRDEEARTST